MYLDVFGLGQTSAVYGNAQSDSRVDYPQINKLMATRLLLESPYPAVVSNDTQLSGKNYDTSTSLNSSTTFDVNNSYEEVTVSSSESNTVPVILGSRDGGLSALTSAY